jgi:hypothetical protein
MISYSSEEETAKTAQPLAGELSSKAFRIKRRMDCKRAAVGDVDQSESGGVRSAVVASDRESDEFVSYMR